MDVSLMFTGWTRTFTRSANGSPPATYCVKCLLQHMVENLGYCGIERPSFRRLRAAAKTGTTPHANEYL